MLTSTLKSALTDEENTQKTHFFTKITHLKSKNAQKTHLNALLNTENAHINKKHTINALLSALNVCFGKKCVFIWQENDAKQIKNVPKMRMSINIATFYTCPGKSAKVPDNLTQCPGIGLKNYGMYA